MSQSKEPVAEIDKAAVVAKTLNVTKGDVNESVDTAKEFAPDAGILLAGLLEGPIGLTLAASSVVKRHVDEAMAEQDKELNQLAELLAKPLGADPEDRRRHIEEAKQSLANLESELAHAGKDADPIGTYFKRVRMFADVFIEGQKKEIEALGEREVDTLRKQDAPPEQIAAAQQRTRAKIAWLDKQKSFFDGSGLLQLEQRMRSGAKQKFEDDAKAADIAKQKAIAANQDLQKETQELLNETGHGDHGADDPTFKLDHKRLEEAQHTVDWVEKAGPATINDIKHRTLLTKDEREQEIKHVNKVVLEAKQELAAAKQAVESKQKLLSQLQKKHVQSIQQQADATAEAEQKAEQAKNNDNRLGQLPGDIAFGHFSEQVQQHFDDATEKIKGSANQENSQLQGANTDQRTQSSASTGIPPIHGTPARPTGGPSGVNGDKLDQIKSQLTAISKKLDEMNERIKHLESRETRHTNEIDSLQETDKLLKSQIREIYRSGLK